MGGEKKLAYQVCGRQMVSVLANGTTLLSLEGWAEANRVTLETEQS